MAEREGLDRRSLVRAAAAAAATSWIPRSAWSQPRFSSTPFTLGVASGSPDAGSVVLWTRLVHEGLAPDTVTVRWELAHDDGFRQVAASGQAHAIAALAHSVHVEAGGLQADRPYFYRFMAGGFTSPTGRTRTLPAADAPLQKLRLAYASCQRWEHGWFSAWRHLAADRPDFVVFLGDYIYEYPTVLRAVRVGDLAWVTTLDDYRRRHALYKTDEDLQAMHAACPWFFTWDDHEVQNDYAGLQQGDGGPAVPDFAARRAAAYQAYYEHMPLRSSVLTRALAGLVSGAELRLYSQQRFGRLANLLLLDGRQYRDPQACTRGGRSGSGTVDPAHCATWEDPARTLLGAAQEQWLEGCLQGDPAGWTVIGQATLFAPRDRQPGPGQSFWNDGWDGYASARRRVMDALRSRPAANPVFLGGDVHENWVGHVPSDPARPGSAPAAVEFCGTSISSRPTNPDRLASSLAENPHFVFADAAHRGYGLADFTPGELRVTLRGVDDVTRRDSGIRTLAAFAVQSGRPLVERT